MTDKPDRAAQIEAATREAIYTSVQTLMLQAAYTDCQCHSCRTLRILGRAMTAALGEHLDAGRQPSASSETETPQTPATAPAQTPSSSAEPSGNEEVHLEAAVDHLEASAEAVTPPSEASVMSATRDPVPSPDSGGP